MGGDNWVLAYQGNKVADGSAQVTSARVIAIELDNECIWGNCAEALGRTRSTVGLVDFSLWMGRSGFGRDPLRMSLYERVAVPEMATPACLNLQSFSPDVSIVRTTGGQPRQVKTPLGFADIQTVDAYKYRVYFYALTALGNGGQTNGSGLYVTNGTPALRWFEVCNPAQSTNNPNCLRIVESVGSVTHTNQYDHVAATGGYPACWKLSLPGGLGVKCMELVTNGTVRTETSIAQITNNAPAIRKKKHTFETFAFGEALTERNLDPDSAQLKTIYTYFTNTTDQGYRKLKQATFPDGRWQIVEYDSSNRTARVFQQLPESSANHNGQSLSENRVPLHPAHCRRRQFGLPATPSEARNRVCSWPGSRS